ncbi:amidohydrolase [Paenibacillus sp. JX-17]|uniref:Amidohydrolase n=1 Tax=Paenibacillus lacisoli TaxID=3064525 RepID=A0ABT9CDJ0_9BACL|nr:amidohydrolase [Paenibacillus sp. JX-17]MDO7907339.1 amidohydrolase [Paenibacillus sp. JX-17]
MSFILFKNAKFAHPASHPGDAVLVEDGVIRAVGHASDLTLQLAGKEVQTIDWQGQYVLPGLVDSHMHLAMHGMKLDMLDFTEAASKEEMLQMIRNRAAVTPPGEWILGLNWNENNFSPSAAPHRTELDEAAGDHPLYLTRTCFHAFLGNSEAFRRAGVAASTPDPESGAFGRDEDGDLNGWIYEEASAAFAKVQPEPDYAVKKAAVRRGILDALRLGLTAVHTEDLRLLGSADTMLRIHRELREEGLVFRTHQLMFHTFLDEMKELGILPNQGDEWIRIGAVKMFSDGALGGRTALLREPYSDAPETSGMAIQTQEHLNEMVSRARALGYPVAVHAIGDLAADMTLTAMETHRLQDHSVLPDRLIHGQIVHADSVARMKQLHLAADIQPRFVASDFPWVLDRVGRRTDYLYAWKKLIDSGVDCAGGSDAPIEPLDPFLGLHAAVTRRRPEEIHEGYLPEEKLSIKEAVDLFTQGSAKAAGESNRGEIKEGMAADFTVVDRDIFDSPESLLQTQVRMTIVNGQVGYSSM